MTIIKKRRGTAAQWTSANTILASGEDGYETDTGKTKTGDGVTPWVSLPYKSPDNSVLDMVADWTEARLAEGVPALGIDNKPSVEAIKDGGLNVLGLTYPVWGYGGSTVEPNALAPTLVDLERLGISGAMNLPGLGYSTRDNGIATPWNTAYAGNVGGVAKQVDLDFGIIPNEFDSVTGQSTYFIYNAPNAMWLTHLEDGHFEFKFRNSALAVFTATCSETFASKTPFRGRVRLIPIDPDNGNVWTVQFYTRNTATGEYVEFGDLIVGTTAITAYKQILTDQTATAYPDQSLLIGTNVAGQVFRGVFLEATLRVNGENTTPIFDLHAEDWVPGSTTETDRAGKTWTIRNKFSTADAPQSNWITKSSLVVAPGEKVHLSSAPIGDIVTTPGVYPVITGSGGFKWEDTPAATTAYRDNNQILNVGVPPTKVEVPVNVDANGVLIMKAVALQLGLARMATESYAEGRAAAARNGAIASANAFAQTITDNLLGQIADAVPFRSEEGSVAAGQQRVYGGLVFQSAGNTKGLPPMGPGDGSPVDQDLLLADLPAINQASGTTGGYGATPTLLTNLTDNASSPAAGSLRKILNDFWVVWKADRSAKLYVVIDPALLSSVDSNGELHIYLDDTPLSANAQYLRLLARNVTIDMAAIPGGLILHGGGLPGPVPYGTLTTAVTAGTYTSGTPLVLQTAAGGADFGKTKLGVGIHVDILELVSGNWVRRATKMTVEAFNKSAGTISVSGTVSDNAPIGCKVIYNPNRTGINYTPGKKGTRVSIGGFTWDDCFGPGKQNQPAGNTIIRNVEIRSNWGGDIVDTGDMKDFTVAYWADNVALIHMEFSNPDPFHDTLTSFVIGTINIGTKYCHWHDHYKAVNHFGGVTGTGGQNPDGTYNTPNEHSFPPKPDNPLEFYTAEDPGPYDYIPGILDSHGNPNGAPIVIIKALHEFALFSRLGQRAPKNDHGGEMHLLNSVVKEWGLPVSDPALGVTSYFPLLPGDDPGNTPAVIVNDGAKNLVESVSFIPYANASAAKTMKRSPTGKSPLGYLKTRNITTHPATDSGNIPTRESDNDTGQVPDFSARYSYTALSEPEYLDKVLYGAGTGTRSKMWTLVGTASVAATVSATDSGVELGPAGTPAVVDKFNFGANLTATLSGRTVTVDAVGGGTSAPDASTTTKGIARFATPTENTTGTATDLIVNPLGLKAAADAAKAYADTLLEANNAWVYKGLIDCSTNPNYPAANAGYSYKVSVAGKIGGASGVNVEVGDTLTCLVDSSAAGNQATVGGNWNIGQTNIDGAVVGPASTVAGDLVAFSGTTGKVVTDSGVSIDTDGTMAANSDARVSTQKAIRTYVANAISAAITALGLGSAATKNVGTSSSTVSAGDVPTRMDYTFPAGNAVLTTGVFRAPIHENCVISSVRVAVGTPPTGSTMILDVKKNGTSIYATTTANRPTVATGASTAVGGTPDTTALAPGDYLTVDILQVGSTNPGANVVISILTKRT